MIYLKNNNEVQEIYIPRTELQSEGFVSTVKTYEDGLKEGISKGKKEQKANQLNLYVTENGEYKREDGYSKVTVDVKPKDLKLQEKSIEMTDETISVEADSDYDALSKVNIDASDYGHKMYVEGAESVALGEMDYTFPSSDEPQHYEEYASDYGYDGFSKITIDIEPMECGATEIYSAQAAYEKVILEGFEGEMYVKGEITEIQRIRPEYGDARYTLDGIFNVYNGRYDGGFGLEVGDWVLVKGYAAAYNNNAQFNAGSEIIEQRRNPEPNLGYKVIEIDSNGDTTYKAEDDGYVGWRDVSVRVNVPSEGGSCYLGEEWITVGAESAGVTYVLDPTENGYDGYSKVTVEVESMACPTTRIYTAEEAQSILIEGDGELDSKEGYVKGVITNISQVSTQYGNATYTLDNCFEIYRGKWMNGEEFYDENLIQIGDWVLIKGVFKNYNGTAQFNANSEVIELKRTDCTDSYNEGYQKGVNEAEDVLKENAQELCITENGTYHSRFSDPYINEPDANLSGEYTDPSGKTVYFYDSAQPYNLSYDTGIQANEDLELTMWFNPYSCSPTGDAWWVIIGSNDNQFLIRRFMYRKDRVQVLFGGKSAEFSLPAAGWVPIHLNKNGVTINGETVSWSGSFNTIEGNIIINNGYENLSGGISGRYPNDSYGVIRINGEVIIPKAEGFYNITRGEYLPIFSQDNNPEYRFKQNMFPYEGEPFKTVMVDVHSLPMFESRLLLTTQCEGLISTVPNINDGVFIRRDNGMPYQINNITNVKLLDGKNIVLANDINLVDGIETDGNTLFDSCDTLTKVFIEDVYRIGSNFITYAPSLKEFHINTNIFSGFESQAIQGAYNLEKIYCKCEGSFDMPSDAFTDKSYGGVIYTYASAEYDYLWNDFISYGWTIEHINQE